MSDSLLFEVAGAVATLTINDAPYNRMSLEFMDEMEARVTAIAADSTIRAVVLTGAGLDNFSVGMNSYLFMAHAKCCRVDVFFTLTVSGYQTTAPRTIGCSEVRIKA
jgi:enoyl-CoA hydratase/carnithine racemase